MSTDIYCTKLLLVISELMVIDVRKNLEENTSTCSGCYAITGEKAPDHISSNRCQKLPLVNKTDGWVDFKNTTKFRPGIMCWGCWMPTVCGNDKRWLMKLIINHNTEREYKDGQCWVPYLWHLSISAPNPTCPILIFHVWEPGAQGVC